MARFWLFLATIWLTLSAVLLGWFHLEKGMAGPYPGTTIGGELPSRKLSYSDWLTEQAERLRAARVSVAGGNATFELTLAELGIEVDIGRMLEQAAHQRESGNLARQLLRWAQARWGNQDLAWLTRFDEARARAALQALAHRVDVPAVDARVDLLRRRWFESKVGQRLDVDATLFWLMTHRDVELDLLPLSVQWVDPTVTLAQLSPVDLRKTLSSFETSFRGRAGMRAVNIRVAAQALNGTIVPPGAVFSFNRVVGPREEERGYREAPVIVDDVLEPGVGGGVCQVATTVHAAAVLGGLQILERRSHSRPSGYAPMGLDATVIDGKVDLRFRNPYPVPLMVSTSFPEPYRLRVEFVGASSQLRYEHHSAVKERHAFYRRIVTHEEMAEGSFLRKQKGIFGYDIVSTVTASGGTGKPQTVTYASKYWPVPEVYWVGPGTEPKSLPPLPEGATGVQENGTTIEGTIPKDVEERTSEAVTAVTQTEAF